MGHCVPERLDRSGLGILTLTTERERRRGAAVVLAGEHSCVQTQPATGIRRQVATRVLIQRAHAAGCSANLRVPPFNSPLRRMT